MSAASPPPTAPATPPGELPEDVRCQQVKANGERCRARRHNGSAFCFYHDPERREDVVAAGRKGGVSTGKRRAVAQLPMNAAITLDTAEDLRALLADTLTRVRRGRLDTATAYCINAIAQTGLRVLEVTELERRLDALERRLPPDVS